jgi:predicted dehydrogenase
MTMFTRRGFLKATAGAGAFAALSGLVSAYPFSRVRGANDDIRIAIIGVGSSVSMGGKGKQHIEIFRHIEGVRIVALCDADRSILAEQAAKFSEQRENVDTHVDMRDVLERKDIDAVVIATPNHWHSLAAVWACQAGKDVYVEKPVSHNIWEGRKIVEAARKYGRIVQAGTQSRSDEALQEVFQYINEGKLGRIKCVHGLCYKRRESIGKVDGPQEIPPDVDYDLWSGPVPMEPLMRKNLHYDWHWFWSTGNGDIGNQGIHEMDMCRWVLGEKAVAPRAVSVGGRFGYDDDGQTPNTQVTILDYEAAPIIFEVRGLTRKAGDQAMDNYRTQRVGIVVQCEDGCFAGGAGGGWVYDATGTRVRQFSSTGGGGHQANFIKAVRSRKKEDLNAEILDGHISSSLCHLANVSYRLGKEAQAEEVRETVKNGADMGDTLDRLFAHLEANEIDLSATPLMLGAAVEMNVEAERFTGKTSAEANKLLKRNYRKPFVVPEEV